MIEKLKQIVLKNKDRLFYVCDNECITYYDFWEKIKYYSYYLKRQGTGPVIVYGHKSVNMLISMFSCLLAKRTYVPIDISVPRKRIEDIIRITNADLFIKNEEIDNFKIETLKLDELVKYHDELEKGSISKYVYIVFTSGSTGEPKGVPISNDNLENFINWISNLLYNNKKVNVLNTANFNFDLSVADMYYSLFNGHTLIAMDDLNYDSMFLRILKANVIVATPTFIKMCLLNPDFNDKNYNNLKTIYFCGEKLEVQIVKRIYERFSKIQIINAYGPTEATSAVCASIITKSMLNNNILPVGDVSSAATIITIKNNEIVLSGKSVFDGYLNSADGFFIDSGDKYYLTGDLGYIKDGLLYCSGRCDNQIKYKGYRIELEEIENVINRIDGIVDSCVVPKYNENGVVKYIKAYIVGNRQKDDILKFLKERLPLYMVPKSIEFLSKLPINENGKVDRKKLINL